MGTKLNRESAAIRHVIGRRLRILGFLVTGILLAVVPSQALAAPELSMKVLDDALYLEGGFPPAFLDGENIDAVALEATLVAIVEFGQLLDSHQNVSTIVLDGPGGSYGLALNIASEINKRQLDTRVSKGAVCLGSCVVALLAGKGRSVNIGASIVWASVKNQVNEKEWPKALNAVLASDIEKSKLLSIMRRAKPGKPYKLSLDDLLALGIELYK